MPDHPQTATERITGGTIDRKTRDAFQRIVGRQPEETTPLEAYRACVDELLRLLRRIDAPLRNIERLLTNAKENV